MAKGIRKYGRYPGHFGANIVKRFIKEGKDFDSFVEQYKNACFRTFRIEKPSDMDLRIAQAVKREKSINYAVKTFKVSSSRVRQAMVRTATYSK